MSLTRPLINTLFSSILGSLQTSSEDNVSGGVTTLSFVGSAVADGETITVPAGAQEGDLAVLFDRHRTAANNVLPTNWTEIYDNASTNPGIQISYKVLGAGEGGSTVTGSNGVVARKVLLVFRPGGGDISSTTVQDLDNQQTDVAPFADTILAGSGTVPLIVMGYAGVDGGTPTLATNTPTMDTVAASSELLVGYKVYNSSPVNHTWEQDDGGFKNTLGSFYLEIS